MEAPAEGKRAVTVSRRKLALVVGLAAVGLLLVSFGRMVLARHELAQRAAAVEREIAMLREENAALQRELAYWRSDEGLERLAREQLGWARPGESAALVIGEAPPSIRKDSPSALDPRLEPSWRRWWRVFFD